MIPSPQKISLILPTPVSYTHLDRLLLVGLLLIMVCVTIESASVYFVTSVSGIFTGIGMIILLFVNVFRTVRGIQHMEDMRQQQELERKQKQTEEMTLQMMRTLAATIEGKAVSYTHLDVYKRQALVLPIPVTSWITWDACFSSGFIKLSISSFRFSI